MSVARSQPPAVRRLRATIAGVVQGVGFRPMVYRLATSMALAGWVRNTPQGVELEIEGPAAALDEFLQRIEREKPPHATIAQIETALLDPVGYAEFKVHPSGLGGATSAFVLPDLATCAECLGDIRDPANRRYRYPFTNCTNCGPRFTIIQSLPYDRAGTTMGGFGMCPLCLAEYGDPGNRRFHAQPNACPTCGPQLAFWDRAGQPLATADAALEWAATALREGKIIAVKGIGGFHLMADARNLDTVERLRLRKLRPDKPLALLYPTLASVQADCVTGPLEEQLLGAAAAPIVLLERRRPGRSALGVVDAVAPHNPFFGVMLPSNPLHHLLLAELGFPIVATSGNRTDEPICTDEQAALTQLAGIAEGWLVHNRPIARHVDDSIVRVALGRSLVLRRARGYAPAPLAAPETARSAVVLATGTQLKNTIALATNGQIILSQHIGDLGTAQASAALSAAIASFCTLYQATPQTIACDAHPDYRSTRIAQQLAQSYAVPLVPVQHHYAHVLACMADNDLAAPVLGVVWDGSGYGLDGTIWGGEFLAVAAHSFERVASLRSFRLPGGEQAIREPRRAALGLLYELFGAELWAQADLAPLLDCSAEERRIFARMLERGLASPVTSSAGRLFDAVAALLGLRQRASFEGQAALELEFLQRGVTTTAIYPTALLETSAGAVADWEPLVRGILADRRAGRPPAQIAAAFHNSLAALIVAVAQRCQIERVALTGGCFQNLSLLERAVQGLRRAGFTPHWHQHIPPNDGGVALGQVAAVRRGFSS
jgi:hydrogenase maturation protein HypF